MKINIFYSAVILFTLMFFSCTKRAEVVVSETGNSTSGNSIGDITTGLIGWYKMDGDAKDASTNAQNGTASNITYTTGHKGNSGKAANFNGSSSIIELGFVALYKDLPKYTFAVWLKPTFTNDFAYIINSLGHGVNGEFAFYLSSTNKVCFKMYPNTNINSTITENSWSHVVLSYDGSTATLYVNGTKVNSAAWTGKIGSLYELTNIGYYNHDGFPTGYYKGILDDLRIYNRTLTQNDITTLYKE